MMLNRSKILLMTFLLGIVLLGTRSSFAGEIWIVATHGSPVDSISSETVKDSFLGKPCRTDSGVTVIPIDRKETTHNARSRFYSEVVKKSNTQLKAYWSQSIFTGKGYPPTAVEDFATLKKTLSSNPSTISYIDPSEKDDSMKVLLKINTP